MKKARSKEKGLFLLLCILLLIIVVRLFFRQPDKEISKEIDIEQKLGIIESNTTFYMPDIYNDNWDSIFVAGPYIDRFGEINMSAEYQSRFESMLLYDSRCILIFIKNNDLKKYADIDRSKADFSTLSRSYIHHSDSLWLDSDRKVYKR